MKFLKLFSFMAVAAIMAACSSNDEPARMNGQEIAARYNELLLGKNSDKWLIHEEGNDNALFAATENQESARKLATHIVGDNNWSVERKTYTLPDGYSSVTVQTPETEGLFLTMAFNVKGMKPLTLNIASVNYILNSSNIPGYTDWFGIYRIRCLDCGTIYINPQWKDANAPIACPACGSENYIVGANN